jgi:hypothetical protein
MIEDPSYQPEAESETEADTVTNTHVEAVDENVDRDDTGVVTEVNAPDPSLEAHEGAEIIAFPNHEHAKPQLPGMVPFTGEVHVRPVDGPLSERIFHQLPEDMTDKHVPVPEAEQTMVSGAASWRVRILGTVKRLTARLPERPSWLHLCACAGLALAVGVGVGLSFDGEDQAAVAAASLCDVELTSTPSGATVATGAGTLGQTPFLAKVPCQKTTFSFSKARHQKATAIAAPAVGQIARVHTKLVRPVHKVTIESTPAGAEVRINGKVVGTTPLTANVDGFTRNRIEVRKAGFKMWSKKSTSKRDGSTIQAVLRKKRSGKRR